MAALGPYPVLTTVTQTGGGAPLRQGRGALGTALSLLTPELPGNLPHCPAGTGRCLSLNPGWAHQVALLWALQLITTPWS